MARSRPLASPAYFTSIPGNAVTSSAGKKLKGGETRPAILGTAAEEFVLEVVVPVFNEERALVVAIPTLHEYLRHTFSFPVGLTIVDNASTDATSRVARRLARDLGNIRVVTIPRKGRGRALKHAWSASKADVLAYMDVDLSTDLNALPALVNPLLAGEADVSIGSRLLKDSEVRRGLKRESISRTYNLILRLALGVRFSDAQCGFKAIRRGAAETILPLTRDNEWFFDTELLVLAEEANLRIREVPVRWVDDPESRVAIVPTALADLKGVARLHRRRAMTRLRLHVTAPAWLRWRGSRSGTAV